MLVIMSNHFWSSLINVSLFILCSCLPERCYTQTAQFPYWDPVLADLEQIIKTRPKIDTSLYTASYNGHCRISVVRCFYIEMEVLYYEADIGGDSNVYNSTQRVLRMIETFLKGKQDKETSQCKECETFEEKQYTEFIEKFQDIVRQILREESVRNSST